MNKKRKISRVRRSLFLILIIWCSVFSIDYVLTKNNLRPIFVVRTGIYKDGGTKEYMGLGYKVIKFNTLDGRKDAVIGTWKLNINNLTFPDNNSFEGTYFNVPSQLFRVSSFNESGYPEIRKIISINNLTDLINALEISDEIKGKILKQYNKEYFLTDSIVGVVLQEPSGSVYHELSNIEYLNKNLMVNINRYISKVGTDDLAWWLILIEVDRGLLENVENLDVKLIDFYE
ncbi:hypothetical protein [Serpentinicella alkaliphila]|uniref:Uncharacterized protein n=1 Tax=Serpentinicella alkaliphila TaxID=1734049 RepID=A0A4R2TVM2_9FIRM|nr:hypothetical protein [Serpentinicella alkaliphila]QUH26814.1 hypothetical protein HZR23_14505 [Serpentinicella alkaliphila]TCQ08038.1 hypothetical protein EDD79_1001123 [Serpentinicella alkaliphila]